MLRLVNTLRHNHCLKTKHFERFGLNPWPHRSSCCTSKCKHQIRYKPYVPQCFTDHDHKNMNMKRPMSPHLTIYAPTLQTTTSIFQRITGVMLAGYAVLLTGGSLFLANGVETYVSVIQSLDMSRSLTFIIKLLLGAPFAFHYCNGIRFCAWNAGRWLAIKDIRSSAFKSWIAAGAITITFALFL